MMETKELDRLEEEHARIRAERDEREDAGEEVGYDTTDPSYRRLRELRIRMDEILEAAYARGGEDYRSRRFMGGTLPAHLAGFYRREGYEEYPHEEMSEEEQRKYGSDFTFYGPEGHGGPRILTD